MPINPPRRLLRGTLLVVSSFRPPTCLTPNLISHEDLQSPALRQGQQGAAHGPSAGSADGLAGNTGQVLIKAPAGHGCTVSLRAHAPRALTSLTHNWLTFIDAGHITVEVTNTYRSGLGL
ncbi:hypothetical protein ASPBRDRAFT_408393 [Aspergillus brasiliensis CBS 101740]|uniref:Uncharacterized protein n=1 Tax=Aspergillus brasiliensis (strain CBS 101740 / IMI 381727 / IBT 21946) TaxID=767769 RepID=A0A1L9UXR8_ASPBC|nr:hypothetical protein ASPBRDRAFT_408393 [Aspergillus brasiliensis CBS 101740]